VRAHDDEEEEEMKQEGKEANGFFAMASLCVKRGREKWGGVGMYS